MCEMAATNLTSERFVLGVDTLVISDMAGLGEALLAYRAGMLFHWHDVEHPVAFETVISKKDPATNVAVLPFTLCVD